MDPNQNPDELRKLRYQIREKELENEALRLKLEASQSSQIAGKDIKTIIRLAIALGAFAWNVTIFVMLCAVTFNPALLEVLDQFIVGFGGLAAGFYLGATAQRMLNEL